MFLIRSRIIVSVINCTSIFSFVCRQLFANENLSGNKQFRYLHANPNNHGLETEPIYDETNKRWIGFQAKFFDQDVHYEQIKHSAEKNTVPTLKSRL